MKHFTYEEAKDASVRYFNGDELAAKVFLDKYALKDENGNLLEDTPEKMHRRLAKEFARIESSKFKHPFSEDQIFKWFDHFRYIIPQGSPMYGIGNNYQIISLSNCFVVESPQDSYGGIMRCDEHLVQIAKRRGGDGVNVSNLRPVGTHTRNAAKSSSGLVSFCERFSNSIREVGQNGRRGALMLMVNIHHPESVVIPTKEELLTKKITPIVIKGNSERGERDIETNSYFYNADRLDFASMKLDRKRVTGANVSIALTDAFLKAVEEGTDYEQRFPIDSKTPKIRRQVDAKRVWEKIIHMAWQSAEPGLLFWDRITSYNAVDCYAEDGFKTICTNPCSEIPLCENDSCRLLVVNLTSFVENPFTSNAKFNYTKFTEVTEAAQRLMDDLIDLEVEKIDQIIQKIVNDPEPLHIKQVELDLWKAIKNKCIQGRRTGLGIVGLADMIAMLNLPYDSAAALSRVNNVFKAFKHAAFNATCEMAKEVGPFPIWNWAKEKHSEFLLQIKEENPELYAKIAKYGRRNIGLLTLAPTGSVSIVAQTSSGGEPVFAPFYTRRKKINPDDNKTHVDFVDEKGDRWQHFKVYHPGIARWMEVTGETDISKSPYHKSVSADIQWESRVDLQAVIQKHIDHAISSTVNLPASATEQDVATIYKRAWKKGCKGITVYREGCRSGVLITNTKKGFKIAKTNAPKRPEKVRGEIFSTVYKKEKLYVAVGLDDDNNPYEVFTGNNAKETIKNAKGIIKKDSRGKYVFLTDSGQAYHLTNGLNEDNADALTRQISGGLRHGEDISFVVHQLEKTEGDLLSFAKVVARILKKFIPDGSKVSGEKCPSCGSELVRETGCVTCKNCGWGKCG